MTVASWWKDHAELRRKVVKWAAILGVVLALICHFVPPTYRALCDAVQAACTP